MFGLSATYWYIRSLIGRTKDDAPASAAETPAARSTVDQSRIRREYTEAANSMASQRDSTWKKMFSEQWRGHYNAQVMLEGKISELRSISEKVRDIWISIGGVWEMVPYHFGLNISHVPRSTSYMTAMTAIEMGAGTDVDVTLALYTINMEHDVYLTRVGSEALSLGTTNEKLFALIQTIEKERDEWERRYMIQTSEHLGRQAALEDEIGKSSVEANRFIHAVNVLLKDSGKPEIKDTKTLNDLHDSIAKTEDRQVSK